MCACGIDALPYGLTGHKVSHKLTRFERLTTPWREARERAYTGRCKLLIFADTYSTLHHAHLRKEELSTHSVPLSIKCAPPPPRNDVPAANYLPHTRQSMRRQSMRHDAMKQRASANYLARSGERMVRHDEAMQACHDLPVLVGAFGGGT